MNVASTVSQKGLTQSSIAALIWLGSLLILLSGLLKELIRLWLGSRFMMSTRLASPEVAMSRFLCAGVHGVGASCQSLRGVYGTRLCMKWALRIRVMIKSLRSLIQINGGEVARLTKAYNSYVVTNEK